MGVAGVAGDTLHSVDEEIISANTLFGFNLFSELVREDAGKNVFISPLSISIALGMTYNGAAGKTQEAMAKALGLKGMKLEKINPGYAGLMKDLKSSDPRVELLIANSLWARREVKFEPDFLKRNKEFYKARITTLDFADPGSPGAINKWVSENTKGKIKKIVEQIDPQTVMFLINAIYCRGKWSCEFDKSRTKDDIFYLLDGTEKSVPMMSQSGRYQYYRGKGFQAVSLPYGDGRMSMYIFLPDEGSSLSDFLAGLNRENWGKWLPLFHYMEGDIRLPRFKLEYEKSLNNALESLGMGIAFDPGKADFRGMSDTTLYIQSVLHKAVVEVNEEGTVAAAVTSVMMGITSVPERFTFIVNRPFFFAIHDNQTNSLLFMGAVVKPG
ncbi:serpin family protein [bacterium]|nr:MAG: serpin family protein [bacterium]